MRFITLSYWECVVARCVRDKLDTAWGIAHWRLGVWVKQIQAFIAWYTKFNVVKPVPHLTIAAETSFRSSMQARA
ncbi:MAG: hypothetical protein ACOYB0_00855 [Polynucleobacter sp.]